MDLIGRSKTLDLRTILDAQRSIAAALTEMPPTAELFDRVLSTITSVLGFDFGAVWRIDGEDDELSCAAAWNAAGTPQIGAFAARSLEQRFVHSRGLPGFVWATGAPAWLTDLVWDPRMASVEAAHRAGLRTAVAVPLTTGERFEGVLELFSATPRELDHDVQLWLASLGAVVAQHLTLWRTYETVAGRDRALAAAVNGVVIADATRDGFPIVYANPGFTRLTGYAAEEIAGRPCSVLNHPDTDPVAIEEFRTALREQRETRVTLLNRRKDGSEFWNEVYLSPVFDDAGRLVQYIGVQNDVTERRKAEEQAEFLAYHDSLTGLANRALLARVLDRAVDRAGRQDRQAALLFLDVDRFKQVNDEHGHAAGDALLREVAERLRGVVRPSDLLARQGGDEFTVLLTDLPPGVAGADAAESIVGHLRAALDEPFTLDGTVHRPSVTIGHALYPADATTGHELVASADVDMYRRKQATPGPAGDRPSGSR